MTQLQAHETTRRRLIQAVAASLLLHLVVIGTASRFQPLPAPSEETFSVTLDIPKATRPQPKPTTPPKPRVAQLKPPHPLNAPIKRRNPPFHVPKRRIARLNRPIAEPALTKPPISNHSEPSKQVIRPISHRNQRSSTDEPAPSQAETHVPRSGRVLRGRRSDSMQLTLNPDGNSHLDSGEQGPLSPTAPSGAANGGSRHDGNSGSDESGLFDGSRSGRILAALPGDAGAQRRVNNASDSDDTGDSSKPDENPNSHGSRHSARRRDDSEHESSAPLPIPPASGFPAPEPTATPKPAPTVAAKPIEVRERPEAKVPDVFRRARIRSQAQPEYPASARAANQEGNTMLRLSISAAGDVTDANIVGSSGSSALDEAAARGARRLALRSCASRRYGGRFFGQSRRALAAQVLSAIRLGHALSSFFKKPQNILHKALRFISETG